jgi:hypothetical protein
MIKCFEANYPESLGVVLVHKAPWIFQGSCMLEISQHAHGLLSIGIWKIIRGWLDPVVATKVQFTNNNTELEAFVAPSRIIRELSGPEDWSYTYIEPVPGENDKMKDTITRDKLLIGREELVHEYEQLILDWIAGDNQIEELRKKRHEVANKLRADYWKLDPYIRARSYYDRVGLIKEGGLIDFYPSKPKESAHIATSHSDVD